MFELIGALVLVAIGFFLGRIIKDVKIVYDSDDCKNDKPLDNDNDNET